MSLRPPLHVSTFHSRTVVSMFGRLCHLFVHALSSLQVANAQCMTLRSLAPCLRAAREKHRFAAGKKHRNGKKHVWQQEKNALQREKAVSAAGKNASKKCRFAAGKIQSSRKNTLQQHKSTFAAEKMHFGGSGKKPSEAGKNPSEARRVFSPSVVITLYFLNLKMCVPECRLSFFQPPKFFVLTNSVFGFTNLLQRHCLLFLWSCHVVIFLMSHANDVCFLPQYFVQEVGRWVSRFLRRHV